MGRLLLLLCLSTVLAGCGGNMKISTDYDKEFDFSGYQSWDWMLERPGESMDPRWTTRRHARGS